MHLITDTNCKRWILIAMGAGGISVTSRLSGGAIGIAVGSSLLLTTGSFEVVLLVTVAVMLVAVVFGCDHRKEAIRRHLRQLRL